MPQIEGTVSLLFHFLFAQSIIKLKILSPYFFVPNHFVCWNSTNEKETVTSTDIDKEIDKLVKTIELLQKDNEKLKKEKENYNLNNDILMLKNELNIQRMINENYEKTSNSSDTSKNLEKAYKNRINVFS